MTITPPIAGGLRVAAAGRSTASTSKPFPTPAFPRTCMRRSWRTCASAAAFRLSRTVFENRFMHVSEQLLMGADIVIQGGSAVVRAVPTLNGRANHGHGSAASASLSWRRCVAQAPRKSRGSITSTAATNPSKQNFPRWARTSDDQGVK